ncbi:MAG: hypothetical protein NVS3B18_02110 [Candidatus Dormibacteria bacterium]
MTGSRTSDHARSTGRWELIRALGALTVMSSPAVDSIAVSLGLTPWSRAEQTQLFMLSLPPYAAIHLGPEGKLGGDGADRIAGVWRTLGLTPAAEPDHLGTLLALYAELGEAGDAARTELARQRLSHARAVVLWEHLWSWVPGYLNAIRRESPAAASWAHLLQRSLEREVELTQGAAVMPVALREAPEPIELGDPSDRLLDALTAPLRVGFILSQRDLAAAAALLGIGLRRGERRFILKTMLEQDATGTLRWLGDHARTWAALHGHQPSVTADPGPWWRARALRSAAALHKIAADAMQTQQQTQTQQPTQTRLKFAASEALPSLAVVQP